jgi:hypothetical protein
MSKENEISVSKKHQHSHKIEAVYCGTIYNSQAMEKA